VIARRLGFPFAKDKVSGRYERSPEKVFEAAKEVIVDNGKLLNEQNGS
jgi:hypothetical protein